MIGTLIHCHAGYGLTHNMASIDNIEVELTIEIGSAQLPLNRLLQLGRGAFIPLGCDDQKSLEILANGRKIAEGRVVLDGEAVTVAVNDEIAA
ncbi:MAG: hypothetical protein HKN14_16065 [Marinicaulis sp.]|nr:hypothetical protein [Marinicaulis sp.]